MTLRADAPVFVPRVEAQRGRRNKPRNRHHGKKKKGSHRSKKQEELRGDSFPAIGVLPTLGNLNLPDNVWTTSKGLLETITAANEAEATTIRSEETVSLVFLSKKKTREEDVAATIILPAPGETTDDPSDGLPRLRRSIDVPRLRDRLWRLLEQVPPKGESRDDPVLPQPRCHSPVPIPKLPEVPDPAPLSKEYLESSHPLLDAVRRNDRDALISMSQHLHVEDTCAEALLLAVELDRPHLFPYLIQKRTSLGPALFRAAQLGAEECIRSLLQRDASLLWRNEDGSTALHVANEIESYRQLLEYTVAAGTAGKVLSAVNGRGETPLHLVCLAGRVDMVEATLDTLNVSLLTKLLATEDNKHRTPLLCAISANSEDTVLALLMWWGHNHVASKHNDEPCPLEWAVREMNPDLVALLLSFNNPESEGSYNLESALLCALQSPNESKSAQREMLRVLVHGGANPCSPCHHDGVSCLTKACSNADCEGVACLLSCYDRSIEHKNSQRRARGIPSPVCRNVEVKTQAERSMAIRDAIVTSLYLASVSSDSEFIACAEYLLVHGGVNLGGVGLSRLTTSVQKASLQTMAGTSDFARDYIQLSTAQPSANGSTGMSFNEWRRWCTATAHSFCGTDAVQCPALVGATGPVSDLVPDAILISEEGSRFAVDSSIVGMKSAKLAAAIRFSSMSRSALDGSALSPVEVETGIPARSCLLLLEHIFHGSIVSMGQSGRDELCSLLLDMLLLAEDLLCPSLAEESILRMLSSDSTKCLCSRCTQSSLFTDEGRVSLLYDQDPIPKNVCLDVFAATNHLVELGGSLDECSLRVGEPGSCYSSIPFLRAVAAESIIEHFSELHSTRTEVSKFSTSLLASCIACLPCGLQSTHNSRSQVNGTRSQIKL